MKNPLVIVVLIVLVVGGYFLLKEKGHDHEHEDHAHEHHHDHAEPKHGGEILEVGQEAAHVELIHKDDAGKIVIYITDGEGEKVLTPDVDPVINLKTDAGPKQIKMVQIGSGDGHYEATDEALKSDPLSGRISISIGGKKYSVDLHHDHHGHDH